MKKERRARLFAQLAVLLVLVLTVAGGTLTVFAKSKKKKTQTQTASVTADASAAAAGTAAGAAASTADTGTASEAASSAALTVDERGVYTSKEEVALYIHTYRHLPSNYITKRKAEELGWSASLGNLWEVAPGKSIGGSRFGNYEGLLPDASGRQYYECDIDFDGGYRNAKRIIYSNDGLIYYTEDHYKTFEQLY